MNRNKLGLLLFSTLLIVVVSLTVLFASGAIRFASSGLSTYIVYVLAGLLASVLCYGLLHSSGNITGHQRGVSIYIQGSVVALVLVAGGGMAYERWFHIPEQFDIRVVFSSEDGQPVTLVGTIDILYANEKKTETVKESSSVLFQGVQRHWYGQGFRLTLDAPPYELIPGQESSLVFGQGPVVIKLRVDEKKTR
jgi:hypothetical protein